MTAPSAPPAAPIIPGQPEAPAPQGPLDAALPSPRRATLAYLALVVVPLLALTWVLQRGAGLSHAAAGAGAAVPPPNPGASFALPLFLVQILVILAISRAAGTLLRRVGQPRVVGEMIAGLLLGPSLLGLLAPDLYAALFPPGTVRFLNAISQLGLVLFMFVMGLEIEVTGLIARTRQNLVTSHAGIALPMFAGGVTALFLYPRYSGATTSFAVFALFLGCAMSITAFPVLARILSERRLAGTEFGRMALECAAIADLTAWIILAGVIGLMRGSAQGAHLALVWTLGGTALYLAVMLWPVRWLVARFWQAGARGDDADRRPNEGELSAVVMLILLSAITTEVLHIHALFGAFVAGLIIPPEPRLRAAIASPFRQLLTVLLLPIFFARAGLRANLGDFSTLADWGLCAGVVTVAVLSKFGGSMLAARVMGTPWRKAAALGSLMNARGLIELVLLTLGLQLGILTRPLFTAMLLMAVITTAMTTPLLVRLLAERGKARAPGAALEAEG